MFNALGSHELLVGAARIVRRTADAERPLEGFDRGVVLSAVSVMRLLACELHAQPGLLESARERLGAALAGDPRPAVAAARGRVATAPDGPAIGDAIGELLAGLPRPDPVRTAVNGALREIVDDEVAALAAVPA